jgi:CRP-like cAMP-binding protein
MATVNAELRQTLKPTEEDSRFRPPSLPAPQTNALWAALSESDRRRLAPACAPQRLTRGTTLYEIGDEIRYAYFPVRGMISLDAMTVGGSLVQVAVIDHNGFIGEPVLLDNGVTRYRISAPFACDVYRMPAATLAQEFRKNLALQAWVLKFVHRHAAQIADTAVCHYFHTIRQRVCRWLLVCADCARSEAFELTQEQLAQMLGVPRQSVSRVATTLQDQALIKQRHGRVRILNRVGLVSCACECYQRDWSTG